MLYRLGATLLAAAFSVPVHAQEMKYGWCETNAPDRSYRLSGLMQMPKSASSDQVAAEFQAAVGGNNAFCWFYYSTPSEGDSHLGKRKFVIESEEKLRYTLTGWVGRYGITGAPPPKPSGAFLTVEGSDQPTQSDDQLRDAALRAQRNAAAERASAIANAARQRADMQAKLDRMVEEMRKRGRAQ